MIRLLSWVDHNAGRALGWMLALALLGAVLAVAACGDETPRPGTAQSAAAGAAARAIAAASATDQAARDAAAAAGRAAAATQAAKDDPTAAKIAAAADARVESAAAQAVADALRAYESGLQAAATAAQEDAEKERRRDDEAKDLRSWVRLCRIVGGAAILGGFLLAAVLAWATKDIRAGRWPGGILAVAGALVIALGPATAWLPWLVAVAVVVAVIWWAYGHRLERLAKERAAAAAIAGSRAVDAVEREIGPKAKDAKVALGDALAAAGLREQVEAQRGPGRDWTASNG